MKSFHLIPLLFLSACSTSPKVTLRPQPSPPVENATVRYPEVVRAYHFGRYVDPSDDLVMHEQHTVFRVEENTRWSLWTATTGDAGVSAKTYHYAQVSWLSLIKCSTSIQRPESPTCAGLFANNLTCLKRHSIDSDAHSRNEWAGPIGHDPR